MKQVLSMEAPVYDQTGQKVGSITLPKEIFGLPWNADLVHQVVVSMQANARTPVAHTKDRGEVRGGGKKPWRQKGTGRARHGSTRSPLWVGGGVTFGPRKERSYKKKINRKMKRKALYTVLSEKWRNGEIIFVNALEFKGPKTAEARRVLNAVANAAQTPLLAERRRNAALLAASGNSDSLRKSFRNFGNIELRNVRDLNPVNVLAHKYLLVENPREALNVFTAALGTRSRGNEKNPQL